MNAHRLAVLALITLLCSCRQPTTPPISDDPNVDSLQAQTPNQVHPTLPQQDTTLELGGHAVDIRPAPNHLGALLLLPGWNFPRTDWCQKSSVCDSALARGFTLVMPEMGKSLYSQRIYPETRADMAAAPTLPWITDTLLPHLQRVYGLFLPTGNNFILGLSTGARGAVVLAYSTDSIFKAIGALSGDFHPPSMANEPINVAAWGAFTDFPARWDSLENPMAHLSNLSLAGVYLAHGKADQVVPHTQTQLLGRSLSYSHPDMGLSTDPIQEGGHDYDFWDREGRKALTFFKRYIR